MKQEYIDLYLKKCKEVNTQPGDLKDYQEIARYLLVNGWIPFNAENVALVGDRKFYMGSIPIGLRKKTKALVKDVDDRGNWYYDEETEIEHLLTIKQFTDGFWIQNGAVVEVKFIERRITEVETTYHVPVDCKIVDDPLPKPICLTSNLKLPEACLDCGVEPRTPLCYEMREAHRDEIQRKLFR